MKEMGRKRSLTLYYPGRGHATLSATGTRCSLRCKHCGGKYLRSMRDVSTPEKFRQVLEDLRSGGKKGFLLSGGCNPGHEIPFHHLEHEIRKAVSEGFRINVHTGDMSLPRLFELKDMGIENVCIDVVGTTEVFREVYGDHYMDPDDFLYKVHVVGIVDVIPHITIGLLGGRLSHEFEAFRLVKKHLTGIEKLVLLSLIPTKGTAYENVEKVSWEGMVKVIGTAREMFPDTELILGCMRPHYHEGEILKMVEVGLDGIVNPSPGLERALEEYETGSENGSATRFNVVRSELCCSF